jgi:tetratricopeptide (TPR) repeat protein
MNFGRVPAARWTVVFAACAFPLCAQDLGGSTASTDVASLRAAVERSPANVGLKIRLASALVDTASTAKRAETAKAADAEIETLFEAVRKARPDAAIPLRAAAREAYYRKRFAEAADAAKKLLAVEPEDIEIATLHVKALLRSDRDAEAAAFFLEWVKSGLSPSSGAVQGLLSSMVGRPKVRAALDEGFAALEKTAPRHPLLRLTRASFFAETGRAEDAWKEFHRAEADGLCDMTNGARHAFALNLAARAPEPPSPGAVAGATLEDLTAAAAAQPQHAGLAMRKGRVLEAAAERLPVGDPARAAGYEAALAAYRAAAALNPDAWSAHIRAAEILLSLDRPAEALPSFAKAVALFPGYVMWRLGEAEAKFAAGDAAGAATSFAVYARRFESDLYVRRFFERCEKRGKLDWGVFAGELEKTAAAEATNPYVRSNLAFVRLKRGDTAGARAAAIEAEQVGLVGRNGVHAHPALREAFGLSLAPESRPEAAAPDAPAK